MSDGRAAPRSGEPAAIAGIAPFELGRLPRVTFGPGTRSRIPDTVARHGRRVLLVTGRRSLDAGGRRATLLAGLQKRDLVVAGSVVVDGEPSPGAIDDALAAHRGSGIEVVLGVGGGSVLDGAKAIAGLLRTGTSARDHLEGFATSIPYPGPAVPFVAVPTTAGTGSEATRNAVLSEPGPNGFKRSFRDERLVAADAIVDPDLLAGAPRAVIAANGMDAVTQLLESYVSLRAGPVTDALALAGLAAARDGLLAWHAAPDAPDAPAARERMAYAALLSGICLAHAGLGAVHGLAAALGAALPIPHGAACGVTLAPVTAANVRALETREPGAAALERYAVLGRLLARLPEETPPDVARAALVSTLAGWTSALELPRLGTYGFADGDVTRIVGDARGSSMRTNPIVLTDQELAGILRSVA